MIQDIIVVGLLSAFTYLVLTIKPKKESNKTLVLNGKLVKLK